jgi:hypothetical protein
MKLPIFALTLAATAAATFSVNPAAALTDDDLFQTTQSIDNRVSALEKKNSFFSFHTKKIKKIRRSTKSSHTTPNQCGYLEWRIPIQLGNSKPAQVQIWYSGDVTLSSGGDVYVAVDVATLDPDTSDVVERGCFKAFNHPKSSQGFNTFCILTVNADATLVARLQGGKCSPDYVNTFSPTLKMNMIEMTPPP